MALRSLRDLPFGVTVAARAEAVLGTALLAAGAAMARFAGPLSGTPTLFAAYGEGALAAIGMALAAAGLLDLAAAASLARATEAGYVVAMGSAVVSISVTIHVLTLGFYAGAMNLFLNGAVAAYLLRWDVRQEYL